MVIVDGECVRVLYGMCCFSTKITIGEFLCQSQTRLPLSSITAVTKKQTVERNRAGQYICDIVIGLRLGLSWIMVLC